MTLDSGKGNNGSQMSRDCKTGNANLPDTVMEMYVIQTKVKRDKFVYTKPAWAMNPSRYCFSGPDLLRDREIQARAPGTIAHVIPGLDPPAILTTDQAGCGTAYATGADAADIRGSIPLGKHIA